MYEAVSLNAIMTHESQRLCRKATFSESFLVLARFAHCSWNV